MRIKKKRFKAIFGNPPYSIDIKKNGGRPKNLWTLFSYSSIDNADEVYYVTPYIWNGKSKKMIDDNAVYKVDLDADKEFGVNSSICYWNTHKKDKRTIHTNGKVIEFDDLSDIEYLPYDVENTLSIHKKMWDKERMGIYARNVVCTFQKKEMISKEKSEEFPYKFFYSTRNTFFYVNEEGINLYGKELYETPKLIIGAFTDNIPFFDREGKCGSLLGAYLLVDSVENLDVRYRQLQSKLAKFYMMTARQTKNNKPTIYMYFKGIRLFPNIPLHITTDADIYSYFDLSDEEISVVEKYAQIATESENKRRMRDEKKV